MSLKKLVNDKPLYDDFLSELDERIGWVHVAMEQAASADQLFRLQGEAAALRKLTKLREQINADSL